METLKIAVVGAGHIGRRHVFHFGNHEKAQVVAISDFDRERRESIANDFGLNHYASLGEMLENEEIDAISVATSGTESGSHHYEPSMEAIAAGKHILIEKPLSNDISEAREIVRAAREKGVLIGVDLNHRFSPFSARLKALQNDGVLGEMLFLNMDLRINNATEKWPYHHIRALHPHSIDVMRYYGGDIERVQCFMHKAPGREIVWSTMSLNVQFTSGAIGRLSGSWDSAMQHGIERCEIGTANGRAILQNINERLEWMPRDSAEKMVLDNGIMGGMGSFEDTFKNRLGAFVEQVLAGGPLDASGEDGLAAQEVIEAAIRSHENGTVEKVQQV